jgi:hypothetical protein
MWRVGSRDMPWRHRRFVVTELRSALVFATTLLLSGLAAPLRNGTCAALAFGS